MTDNSIQTAQLERVLEKYERLIFSICYRMVGDYFEAQDATQETFLTYYKVLDRFDGQNEKAFLTKIATNKCLDFLKQKRRKEMPSESEVLESRAGTVSSPEERFLEEEVKDELAKACRDLKPPYGQIAYEFYCCDRTAREIAEQKGIKLKTVQTQVLRARKMLQKKLGPKIVRP
ncbi:sigma-70 family RNA polymerase sigma factor [Jutongia sp.]|uniref:RNA polymerase sigma factor n=1 Tax=Jutongia sp. TaxID=2944204 RepID=UPI00307A9C2D